MQFLAGLKDKVEKLKRLDALRLTENLTVEELLQTLLYRSQTTKFASGPELTWFSDTETFSHKTGNFKNRFSARPSEIARCGAEPAHQKFVVQLQQS